MEIGPFLSRRNRAISPAVVSSPLPPCKNRETGRLEARSSSGAVQPCGYADEGCILDILSPFGEMFVCLGATPCDMHKPSPISCDVYDPGHRCF